jgi:hypothetical protein
MLFLESVGCPASRVEGPRAVGCFDSVAHATTLSTNGVRVSPDPNSPFALSVDVQPARAEGPCAAGCFDSMAHATVLCTERPRESSRLRLTADYAALPAPIHPPTISSTPGRFRFPGFDYPTKHPSRAASCKPWKTGGSHVSRMYRIDCMDRRQWIRSGRRIDRAGRSNLQAQERKS